MSRYDNQMKQLKDGEKRFFVHFRQAGDGYDYMIACGQGLYALPKHIKTREQAEAYVLEEDGDKEGQLDYHSVELDDIDSISILESTVYPVDVAAVQEEQRKAEREREHAEKEADERREFERLKAKFRE